jgi:hypothetical protein
VFAEHSIAGIRTMTGRIRGTFLNESFLKASRQGANTSQVRRAREIKRAWCFFFHRWGSLACPEFVEGG